MVVHGCGFVVVHGSSWAVDVAHPACHVSGGAVWLAPPPSPFFVAVVAVAVVVVIVVVFVVVVAVVVVVVVVALVVVVVVGVVVVVVVRVVHYLPKKNVTCPCHGQNLKFRA